MSRYARSVAGLTAIVSALAMLVLVASCLAPAPPALLLSAPIEQPGDQPSFPQAGGSPNQSAMTGSGETPGTSGTLGMGHAPQLEPCGAAYTPIYTIQGAGTVSPLDGAEVALEGIVVGDFQNNASLDNGNLRGFHVQDPAGDGDTATSDGIFVYGAATDAFDIVTGDRVRVRGTVSEYNGMTEVTASQIWACASDISVALTALSLPVSSLSDWERYEGMLVTFPQALVISDSSDYDRYNEIVLTSARLHQPTSLHEPGSPEALALAQANLLARITLDDGRSTQNPDPAIHPNGLAFDLTNLFRGGDTVTDVTGVVDYARGVYRIQPTQGANYASANPRETAPESPGCTLTVASLNVLNYFTTIDTGVPICGPSADQDCRGADNANEFIRQRTKIVAALAAMDADVVGLIEIENHPGDVPVADLVAALNAVLGAGTYDYVPTGAIGIDAIRQAMIYKPGRVTPVGAYAILEEQAFTNPLGYLTSEGTPDELSRPALAQSFRENATGATFAVVVNHLKSKGSPCDALPPGDEVRDDDPAQGNCNLTRTLGARALVDWLATDPTGNGDPVVLIIGDLNAYAREDPVGVFRAGGYTDEIARYLGEGAYTYMYDGQVGNLDHALARTGEGFEAAVTGVTVWHINADEPDLIDYDTTFKRDAQDLLFAPDPYRSSDHDPVIIGLNLRPFDARVWLPLISR